MSFDRSGMTWWRWLCHQDTFIGYLIDYVRLQADISVSVLSRSPPPDLGTPSSFHYTSSLFGRSLHSESIPKYTPLTVLALRARSALSLSTITHHPSPISQSSSTIYHLRILWTTTSQWILCGAGPKWRSRIEERRTPDQSYSKQPYTNNIKEFVKTSIYRARNCTGSDSYYQNHLPNLVSRPHDECVISCEPSFTSSLTTTIPLIYTSCISRPFYISKSSISINLVG